MFLIQQRERGASSSRFYNGIEKGRAKLHSAGRALKFERELADKICAQLAAVDNKDWFVVDEYEV